MQSYYYDLHIHTCLSPCGDEAMTPPQVAGFAALAGLDLIAICDHNTACGARAVIEAGRLLAPELLIIPGMELNCREEAHVICLFPDCEAAEAASQEVYGLLPPIRNREDIYGPQLLMDREERVLRHEERLLITAADLSVDAAVSFAARYGGFAFPAHIDRESESVLSALGCIPPEAGFTAAEVAHPEEFFRKPENACYREQYHILTSSDAHRLTEIRDKKYSIRLAEKSFPALRQALTAPKNSSPA